MDRRFGRVARVGLLALFALVATGTAWVCDDAYITFRVVDNFAEGYGLRWNVAERVQVYTHPLWMFLLGAVERYTGEMFYTALALSLVVSIAAVAVLLFGVARATPAALVAASALVLSKAFVDFSTSGLENPLTHLLLAAAALLVVRAEPELPALLPLSLIASTAALNRPDTLLLYLPLLGLVWWRGPRLSGVGALALGFLPLLAWEAFAILYYGFPFPNTAYAKLQTGVGRPELVLAGLRYLASSLTLDPLSPLCVAGAAAVTLARRQAASLALAAGLASYLAYTVWIGGDFMAGRFLSPVVFGAALLLARFDVEGLGQGRSRRAWAMGAAALLVTGLAGQALRLATSDERALVDAAGIADERRVYVDDLGLLAALRRGGPPSHPWVRQGLELRAHDAPMLQIAGGVGLLGYYAGPAVHVLDVHGLGDPFLARLPAEPGWRVGHFVREPRADYVESLRVGHNRIVDPDVALYCEKLFRITRGELLDRERLGTIVAFNLGRYDYLLDGYLARKAARARGMTGDPPR